MPQEWDRSLHKLIRTNPQAFVDFILPGAQLKWIYQHPEKLKECQVIVDALLEVETPEGERMLIHIEIQSHYDSDMPERLLRYNVIARCEYGLPVLSCVIHLLDDTEMKRSPLRWSIPLNERSVLNFDYIVIEVANLTAEDIRQREQAALLPLLPLTKDGATRQTVQQMLENLTAQDEGDLAEVGFILAWLKFSKNNPLDTEWLKRRYRDMFEILREEPIYTEIFKEGGIHELQQAAITIVVARFLQLESLARTRIITIDNLECLRQLIIDLTLAHSQEETERLLLSLGADETNH